jgi:uncharacterized protein (TIGR03437 family)
MIAIAAGYDHHLALRNDGTVWGWGSNTCGQAGRDPGVVRDRATNWSEAVQIAGISDAVAISAGGSYHFFSFGHSLALKADGSVWAWGCNDGFAVVQSTARQVSGLAEAAAVAAGGEHSLVVKKDDGTIWGWGWNAYGVLGDGTTSGCNDVVTTPVQASGLAGVVALSAGGYNNLAMTSDGTVWAWGGDYCCVLLDDGTTITRLTPAQVKGLPPLLMEPAVSAVISAASFRAEPVAPGQIVSVFGRQIGPAAGAISVPSSAGIFESTLAQTRVLFDGIAAPLLFAQAGQVNAVAPYALAGKTATEVQVEYRGVKSSPQKLAVAETAPGIFTVGASGAGQGMIFNEDGSLNSTSKPARRGSTVTLFATGEGQTSPPGVDGTVAAPPLGRPVAPVSLQVGGQEAEVRESVSAPGLAGVLQVKVRIPEAVTAGSAVPVTLKAGPVQSQTGVTVAVQ